MVLRQYIFNALLRDLLSTDNELCSNAEFYLEKIVVQQKLGFLLNSLSDFLNPMKVRDMAGVLLRRLLQKDFEKFYPTFTPMEQQQLKETLLKLVQSKQSKILNKRICDCAIELARNLIDDDGNNLWPEFLEFLLHCASSQDARLRESALYIFASFPGVFGNQQERYIQTTRDMLMAGVSAAEPNVCTQAAKAIAQFIVFSHGYLSTTKMFNDCLPIMLHILAKTIEAGDDDGVLRCFVELADICPKFLYGQLNTLFGICVKAISNEDLKAEWRHLALEVIVSVSEAAAPMVRMIASKHVTILVPKLLRMMIELEDEEEWATADYSLEEDKNSDPVVAAQALDRLACALGGKLVLPLVITVSQEMLAIKNWRARHAALMAIGVVGEGCHKQMEAILPQIVECIIKFLHDAHPRVRYAACNTLGQMSNEFAPIFVKKFHKDILPSLCSLLDDNGNPRVQAHAAAALANFFEKCPKTIILSYIPNVAPKLEVALNIKTKELAEKESKLVLKHIIIAMGILAYKAEEKFKAYYDNFMPGLKKIIEHLTNVKKLEGLRGKTIECAFLIGLTAGPEKFRHDAGAIMDLLQSQSSDISLTDDSTQWSYMICAWARICQILGQRFAVYLPQVMGPVMKAASLKPEVAIMNEEDAAHLNDDDWQLLSLVDQNFGIFTASLEKKVIACETLICYAKELKEAFVDYTEDVIKLMVQTLKFDFNDTVRIIAAKSFPCLLECARTRGAEYMVQMWQYIVPELLTAIDDEPNIEVLGEMLSSFSDSLNVMKAPHLSITQKSQIKKILDRLIHEHFKRVSERKTERVDKYYDEQVIKELQDEEDADMFLFRKVKNAMKALNFE